jgi:hypothetical protein
MQEQCYLLDQKPKKLLLTLSHRLQLARMKLLPLLMMLSVFQLLSVQLLQLKALVSQRLLPRLTVLLT